MTFAVQHTERIRMKRSVTYEILRDDDATDASSAGSSWRSVVIVGWLLASWLVHRQVLRSLATTPSTTETSAATL